MSAESEFERLAAMLPFYVNGTLGEDARRQVEVALAFSVELRERLDEERELAAGVIADTEAGLAGSDDTGEERLSQMIAGLPHGNSGMNKAAPRQQAGPADGARDNGSIDNGPGDGGGLARALSFLNPRRWNPTAVLGAGVLGLGGVAGWQATMIDRLEAENYELLSGECEKLQVGGIMVEFAADSQWDAIVALLDREGLAIVSGSAFGVVTLSSSAVDEELTQQIERLRASPLIAVADPVA